jgi:anti-sigma factor RsiW
MDRTMNHPSRPEGAGPTPQLLAAYVDGELGPADRAAVDAWLCDHPEARADVAAQRRLTHLWRAAPPPDPGDAAWADELLRAAGKRPAKAG